MLSAAAAHDHKARRALFVIDGDLSWVRGEAPPNIVGLHQHDAYCIENLLVCEEAAKILLSQEKAITEQDAAAALDFANWRATLLEPLTELFAAFATLNEVDPTVATVSDGVGILCKKKSAATCLDTDKVRVARENAMRAAKDVSNEKAVATRFAEVLRRINSFPDPLLAVSGKDYVIPLIDFHLQNLGCRIRRKSLRMRLASSGRKERFLPLVESLLSAARGHA